MLTTETLWNGSLAQIEDVRCACRNPDFSNEEVSVRAAVVFPRRGTFVRLVGRCSTVADPGQALFFNKGEPYRVRHPTSSGDHCTAVMLTDTALEGLTSAGLMSDTPGTPWFPFRSSTTSVAEDVRHRKLVDGLNRGSLGSLEVEETVLELIERTLSSGDGGRTKPARPGTRRRHRHFVTRARELIASEPTRELPLTSIAGEVGCSSYHLARIFRAHVGVTLHQYQNRLRLRAALERLSAGEQNLTELALDLGFYDHSHFTNVFRRELNCRPSDWRREALTPSLQALAYTSQK